jgi:hypothetical protein
MYVPADMSCQGCQPCIVSMKPAGARLCWALGMRTIYAAWHFSERGPAYINFKQHYCINALM